MSSLRRLCRGSLLFFCSAATLLSNAASAATPPTTSAVAPVSRHDGRHDFDFNVGTWHSEIHRILDPLSGANRTVDLHGTVTIRPLWNGRAQIEELDATGPSGRMQGVTLFLYDPAARQWSQSYAGVAGGPFTGSLIGSFENGRGTLIANDTYEGRAILVRATWFDIEPDSHRIEESFSIDGGGTWLPAFAARLTRVRT